MKLNLREQSTQFTHVLQSDLFPVLEESIGQIDDKTRQLVAILEMIPLARFVPSSRGWIGRPCKDRLAIASAFVAKAVYGYSLTRQLLQRLRQDEQLRRICGWESPRHVPHESTFSRAFAEFARMELPQFVHEALIAATQKNRLIGHISRDSTAIEARERFAEPRSRREKPRKKVGAPRGPHKRYKGGKRPHQPQPGTRLHAQRTLPLEGMLKDLPQPCDIGAKAASNGHLQFWKGYKLHLDVADGQIPISCILTSASVHDTQVAIPLATMTSKRVVSLYDLMDAGYDSAEIREHSRELGHVPIIPYKKLVKVPFGDGERQEKVQMKWAEEERFGERTAVERVYARLKDEFGARDIRVRGSAKVMAHLMFGILVLTVDQILKLSK